MNEKELEDKIKNLEDYIAHLELDLEVYQAIESGDWPNSNPILVKKLKLQTAYEELVEVAEIIALNHLECEGRFEEEKRLWAILTKIRELKNDKQD